jgi:hypothetical protein
MVPRDYRGAYCRQYLGALVMPRRSKLKAPITLAGTKPPETVHDRRASDEQLLMNSRVVPVEVDDPFDAGKKILVLQSTRDDPLAALRHSKHIDDGHYRAARAWQEDWRRVQLGNMNSVDTTKEFVDGGQLADPISDAFSRSMRNLKQVAQVIGMIGETLLRDILVDNLTIRQAAEKRGRTTEPGRKFVGSFFRQCLEEMAVIYGVSNKKRTLEQLAAMDEGAAA